MDVEPASIVQVRKGTNGRMVLVQDDAGNVAQSLIDIDPSLKLRYSESGGYWVVYELCRDGVERLVLTAQDCDHRIVHRVQRLRDPGYRFADELDRVDREADRDIDRRWSDQIGEVGQQLAHALRQDLGVNTRIVVPRKP